MKMDKYYVFLVVLAFPNMCEAFVFTSSPDATTAACDGETVAFNWTYASGTPSSITWTKMNNDATLTTVASYSIGFFDPNIAYGTRVTQVGTNAAIQLSGVTPADNGIYEVEITDASSTLKGNTTLTIFDIPVGTITASYMKNTGVVKCDGLSSLGSGSFTLVLDGNTTKSTQSLPLEFTRSKGGRYCCCVIMSDDAAKCLPAGESFTNCSAKCLDVEATTTAPSQPTDITSTTSATPGLPTGKELYYLFFIPLGVIMCVVVVVVVKRRRKKKKDSNSTDLKHSAGNKSNRSTKSTNLSGDQPGQRL